MLEAIILAIPVIIIFYLVGKWLKESEKRDEIKAEEERKKEIITQSVLKNKPEKEHPILNIVLIIIVVIIGLWFLTSILTDFGGGGSIPYGTEEEWNAWEEVEGSK